MDIGNIAENRLAHDLIEVFLINLIIKKTQDLDTGPRHRLDLPDNVHPQIARPDYDGSPDVAPTGPDDAEQSPGRDMNGKEQDRGGC